MKPIIRTLFFTLALALPQAHAGLISSDDAQVSGDRERLKALIARPELAQQIEKLGILPHEAVARVDAMNDAEVRNLAGRLDALPAGGELSTNTLVVIVVILLLVILL